MPPDPAPPESGRNARFSTKTGAPTSVPGRYKVGNEELNPDELIAKYEQWQRKYAIFSMEDIVSEVDIQGQAGATGVLGHLAQVVGDDWFVTQLRYLQEGIEGERGNAILLKDNQVGTWQELATTWFVALGSGWGGIISHRSGETLDDFMADLAVALATGQIKPGAPFGFGDSRAVVELGEAPTTGERTAKMDRLADIEAELGDEAEYAGWQYPPAVHQAYRARTLEQYTRIDEPFSDRIMQRSTEGEQFVKELVWVDVVLIHAEAFGEGPDLALRIERYFSQLADELGVDSIEEAVRRSRIKLVFHDPRPVSADLAKRRFGRIAAAVAEATRGAVELKEEYFSAFIGGSSARNVAQRVEEAVGVPISLVIAPQEWVDQLRQEVPSLATTMVAVVFGVSSEDTEGVSQQAALFDAGLEVLAAEGRLDPTVVADLQERMTTFNQDALAITTQRRPIAQRFEGALRTYWEILGDV